MNAPKTATATWKTQYLISFAVSPSYSGTTSPSGTNLWKDAGVLSISATPSASSTFSSWSSNTGLNTFVNANSASTTAMIGGPGTITANFDQNEYVLAVYINGSGTVAKDPDQATYHLGDEVTLTATAEVGWSFAGWTGDVTSSSTQVLLTIDVTPEVTATFTQEQYSLTVYSNPPEGGSVGRSNPGPYDLNDEVTLTATAATGYTFTGWSGDLTGTTNPAQITITGNMIVTANFARISVTLTLTANPPNGGSIAPSILPPYQYGDSVQLTAITNAGYSFSGWSEDLSGIANTTWITLDGNKAVTANFALETYTITATSGPNGNITPNGTTTINYGDSKTFTITASTGYHILEVEVDGASIGPVGTYTFNNVQANHTISATFAINTYTITVTQGAHGTITPGTTTVNYGANQGFAIIPDANYQVADVIVGGISVGPVSSYTFNNVTANHSITASFTLSAFTITFTETGLPSGTLWSVTFNGATKSSITNAITFSSVVAGGYAWSASTPVLGSAGTRFISASSTGTLNIPTQTTQTINYTTQYFLTVNSAYDTPSGSGWFDKGATAYASLSTGTIAEGAGTQHVFTGWSDDAIGSTLKSLGIVMNAPKTATANWKTQYYLTVTSPYGSTGGFGWYDEGTTAYATLNTRTILSGSDVQYAFTNWGADASGTNYAQSNSIIMTAPRTATANWKMQFLIIFNQNGVDNDFLNLVITVNGTSYDRNGATIWADHGDTYTFSYNNPLVVTTNGKQYALTGVSGNTTSATLTVIDATSVTGFYKTQFHTTFTQSGVESDYEGTVVTINGIPHGRSGASFWTDAGSSYVFSYSSILTVTTNVKHYILTNVDTISPVVVLSPVTVTATYGTFVDFATILPEEETLPNNTNTGTGTYYITVISEHGSPTPSARVKAGSNFTVTENSPDGSSTHRWICNGYSIDGASITQGTTYKFVNIQANHTITFNWIEQFYLTINSQYGNPTGQGWYDAGASAQINVTTPATDTSGNRYLFDSWNGAGEGAFSGSSPSASVIMNNPITENANWNPEVSTSLFTVALSALLLFLLTLMLILFFVWRRRRKKEERNGQTKLTPAVTV